MNRTSYNDTKARECPHCRRPVSLKVCSEYLLSGTSHVARCNHCGGALLPAREPVPFQWCVSLGFLSTAAPGLYFLFVQREGLLRSLAYAAAIGVLALGLLSCFILSRLHFKEMDK